MTAKEFIEKELLEFSLAEYDEGGFLGIDCDILAKKMEDYHQAKSKMINIDRHAVELLKKWWEYFDKECIAVNCNEVEREFVINHFLINNY